MADETTTFIKGRGARTALLLLTAAAQLELDKHVVRAQQRGYLVPNEVAERYEALLEELESEEKAGDPDPEPDPKPTRKRAVKKTAASTRTQE